MSASSPCSASHVMAFSNDSLPAQPACSALIIFYGAGCGCAMCATGGRAMSASKQSVIGAMKKGIEKKEGYP